MLVLAIMINLMLSQRLPMIVMGCLFLHIAGFLATIITLWVKGPVGNAHDVILDFSSNSGWRPTGLATMIGLLSPISGFTGSDCAIHMAEEIRDASTTLPKTVMATASLNTFMSTLIAFALAFTVGNDLPSILSTHTGQPFMAIYFHVTKSHVATTILSSILIIMFAAASINEIATTSRQIWSFARDGGLPFSGFLSKISPTLKIPVNAILVSVIISSLLVCINLGSSDALNAVIGVACVAILTSYFVTISCLVHRRLCGPALPPHRWSLGRYGLFINIISLAFLIPCWFFIFWPLTLPVTAASMNWSAPIFFGILALALIHYVLKGRFVYVGPVAHVKRVD